MTQHGRSPQRCWVSASLDPTYGNASNPENAIKSGERVPLMAKMGVEAIEAA